MSIHPTINTKQREVVEDHVQAFLDRGGRVDRIDGKAKASPYLESRRQPLHAYCDSTPATSIASIRRREREGLKKWPEKIAVWKVAAALGIQRSVTMAKFRAKIGNEYPQADFIFDGGKGTQRLYWKPETILSAFGEDILAEVKNS